MWIPEHNVLPSAWISGIRIWSIPSDSYLTQCLISAELGSVYWWLSCTCFGLSDVNPMFFFWLTGTSTACSKYYVNLGGGYHSHHIFYRLVILKLIYASMQVCNIFLLRVCFTLSNFVFQVFLFFFSRKFYCYHILTFRLSPFIWIGFCYQFWALIAKLWFMLL